MPFFVGSSGGFGHFSAVSSLAQAEYQPVQATAPDIELIYDILPDIWTRVQNMEPVENIWKTFVLYVAGELLRAWEYNYSKSLSDIQILSQRKWVKLDLVQKVDMVSDPSWTYEGIESLMAYSASSGAVNASWVGRGGFDRYYKPLTSQITQEATLSWEATLTPTELPTIVSPAISSLALVGYFKNTEDRLHDGVAVGIGFENQFVIAHTDANGVVTAQATPAAAATQAQPNVRYQLKARYYGATTSVLEMDVYAEVTAVSAEAAGSHTAGNTVSITLGNYPIVPGTLALVSGSSTITDDGSGNLSTTAANPGDSIDYSTGAITFTVQVTGAHAASYNRYNVRVDASSAGGYAVPGLNPDFTDLFQDLTQNFLTSGVQVKDKLQIYDTAGNFLFERSIAKVTATQLTLDAEILSTGTNQLPYKITGSTLVTSLAMDVSSAASDERFTSDSFGLHNVSLGSTRPKTAASWSAAAAAPGLLSDVGSPTIKATVHAIQHLDPSVLTETKSIPYLQPNPLSQTGLLKSPTNFEIGASEVRFFASTPAGIPTTDLYAEYVQYDEGIVEANFGSLVDLVGASTEQYLATVKAMFYAYLNGPTVTNVKAGSHIFMGLPIAEQAGTVTAINAAYSGDYGQLSITDADGEVRTYLYPLNVGTPHSVGSVVTRWQPLSNGIEINDYKKDPAWFLPMLGPNYHETQKYHTFQIVIDATVFSLSAISQVGSFVGKIKPTWKDFIIYIISSLSDTISVTDALYGFAVTDFTDPVFPALVPTYDAAVVFSGLSVESAGYDPLFFGNFAATSPSAPLLSATTPSTGNPAKYNWVKIQERDPTTGNWLYPAASHEMTAATGNIGKLRTPGGEFASIIHNFSGPYTVHKAVTLLIYSGTAPTGKWTRWESDSVGVITCASDPATYPSSTNYLTVDYSTGELDVVIDAALNAAAATKLTTEPIYANYATQYVQVHNSTSTAEVPLLDFWYDQTPSPQEVNVTGEAHGTSTSGPDTFTLSNLFVKPATLTLTAASADTVTANAAGVLSGDGTGTVNYGTGAVSVTFDSGAGNAITAAYTYTQAAPYSRKYEDDPATANLDDPLQVATVGFNWERTATSQWPSLASGSLTFANDSTKKGTGASTAAIGGADLGKPASAAYDNLPSPVTVAVTGEAGPTNQTGTGPFTFRLAHRAILPAYGSYSSPTYAVAVQASGVVSITGEARGTSTAGPDSFTLVHGGVVPTSVTITAGSDTVTDPAGDGVLKVGPSAVGSINYYTGAVVVTFPTATSHAISVNYQYKQTLIDHGSGVLTGTGGSAGVIDYKTGDVSVSFGVALSSENITINYHYVQPPDIYYDSFTESGPDEIFHVIAVNQTGNTLSVSPFGTIGAGATVTYTVTEPTSSYPS